MDDAQASVAPGQANRPLVVDAEKGQRQRNSVESSRLLVQVVVVLSLPADVGREGSKVGGLELRSDVDLGLGNGRESHLVHPSLHDKRPEVEANDGADEGVVNGRAKKRAINVG